MIDGQGYQQALPPCGSAIELGGFAGQEADVEPALGQFGQVIFRRAFHQIQQQAGIARQQPSQQDRKASRPDRADDADPQHVLLAPGLVGHAFNGLVKRGDRALGAGHEVMARLGQAHARRASFEDGRSEAVLKFADPA